MADGLAGGQAGPRYGAAAWVMVVVVAARRTVGCVVLTALWAG